MPKIWCIDVDETLEISSGPVKVQVLRDLHDSGDIVGIVGNWGLFCSLVPDWHRFISFVSACPAIQNHEGTFVQKDWFMNQLRTYIPHDEIIMVGNILGISGASDDKGAADRIGIRFISELDFANGVR